MTNVPLFSIFTFDFFTDINSQVTIVTKTFIRYRELGVLINSIRQYYPHIKIIIADDSFKPEVVNGTNIEQYIMPGGQVCVLYSSFFSKGCLGRTTELIFQPMKAGIRLLKLRLAVFSYRVDQCVALYTQSKIVYELVQVKRNMEECVALLRSG